MTGGSPARHLGEPAATGSDNLDRRFDSFLSRKDRKSSSKDPDEFPATDTGSHAINHRSDALASYNLNIGEESKQPSPPDWIAQQVELLDSEIGNARRGR